MNNVDKNIQTVEAYNKNSEHYSAIFDGYSIRSEDIDRALKLNESGSISILELGCGNGRDAEYIVSKVGFKNYMGIDASASLIERAKEKVPKGNFIVGDMRDYLSHMKQFGIIFAFASLLHMKHEELIKILKNCQEMLKTGGILYISSKYGEYREIEVKNLGNMKYYYSYMPEDIEKIMGDSFSTVFKIIHDSEYGPSFTLALKKK